MPKRVDHQERKTKIINAFFEFAVKEGLDNVTLRGVASQADISLRLVQYYFGTRDALVQSGLELLENQSYNRFNETLISLEHKDASTILLTLFKVAIPSDESSRKFHFLWNSYALLSLTSSLSLSSTILDSPNRLQKHIMKILKNGVLSKELRTGLNIEIETITLLSLINGLGNAVLLGQQSVETAIEVFSNHLNCLK